MTDHVPHPNPRYDTACSTLEHPLREWLSGVAAPLSQTALVERLFDRIEDRRVS